MSYGRLILTNLHRHQVRSLFGISGIAFGVAAMLTVLAVIMGAIGMFRKILESDSHYLLFERNVSDLFFSSVPGEVWARLETDPQVAAINPMLFGIVNAEGHPVITCFGVTPDNPRIAKARWLEGKPEDFREQRDAVFLGARAADFLEARRGDKVKIGTRDFRVGGVVETENGFEDGGVFFPLGLAQEYFHREGLASVVSITLKSVSEGEAFKERIEAEYPRLVLLASEEFESQYSQFRILTATAWAVGMCAFLLGGLSVANTMTMSVFTRIREIAILRVCGFSRGQTAGLVLGEGFCLAVLGVLLGLACGTGLLMVLERIPQLQGYVAVSVSPAVLGMISVTALVTSLAGSIYPAWYASRIQPAEALRYE